MAELLGVIASGIAVLQITNDVVKGIAGLNALWHELDDVAEDVQELFEEIQVCEPLLLAVRKLFEKTNLPPSFWDDTSTKTSLRYCEQALELLKGVVDELEDKLAKAKGMRRKFVKAKIALKKGVITRLDRRRRRAMDLLGFAMDTYTMAQQSYITSFMLRDMTLLAHKSTPLSGQMGSLALMDAVEGTAVGVGKIGGSVAGLRQALDISEEGPPEPSNAQEISKSWTMRRLSSTGTWQDAGANRQYSSFYLGKLTIKVLNHGSHYKLSFQPPEWLPSRWLAWKLWEFESRQAYSGFQFNFRHYNVRPYTSTPAFRFAQQGKLKELLELFERGEASPFDRNAEGQSLLYYAASGSHGACVDVCRSLLGMGLQHCLDETFSNVQTGTETSLILLSMQHRQLALPMMELFARHRPREDIDLAQVANAMLWLSCRRELFRSFVENFCPMYYRMPSKERFSIARRCAWLNRESPVRIPLIIHPEGIITAEDICVSSQEGVSLIHTAAVALGGDSKYLPPIEMEWKQLLMDLVRKAEARELHHVERVVHPEAAMLSAPTTSSWTGTPLASLLHKFLADYLNDAFMGQRLGTMMFEHPLAQWLKVLKACGVDLEEYGKQEKAAWERLNGSGAGRFFLLSYMDLQLDIPVYICDFDYGPDTLDWVLHWERDWDVLVGEFWEMVEPPAWYMPGGWPEEA